MRVLELFAGTRSISRAFDRRGHKTFSIEWDKKFENIDIYDDINNITAERIIELCGGVPDVIWASPDCTTYSVAAISHHREKDEATGNLNPESEYAKFCDKTNKHVLELIRELNPKYYFIENPRGAAQDELHDRPPKIHGDLLPIRRQAHETDRHLDESSRPEIPTDLQERRTMPRKGSTGEQNRHPGAKRLSYTKPNPARTLRAHRRHLRINGE